MGLEIERKFLVDLDKWLATDKPAGELYRQGYILKEPDKTVRVRLTDTSAFMTIKGAAEGLSRKEFEYKIPQEDANDLLDNFCITKLSKIRYKIVYKGKTWEVDVFHGENEGLIVAEIELESEDEAFEHPKWLGPEVTSDVRYYNSNLTSIPYTQWAERY